MDTAELHARYEEGRRFPRVKLLFPVQLWFEKKHIINAKIFNLSPDGLQIRCDRETASTIHPINGYIEENSRPIINVAFSLPTHKGDKKVIAQCQICYAIVLDKNKDDGNAFGLHFTKFKRWSNKHINNFLFKR